MKRILAFFTFALLTMGIAFAQIHNITITGVVIDNNGNPLPGAEVIATGGGASTMTDADGSFSLNVSPFLKSFTVYYVGLGSKTQNIKGRNYFVVTMAPRSNYGFINAFTGYVSAGEYGSLPIGIMGGMLGKWGFYAKYYYASKYGDYGVLAGFTKSIYKRNSFIYVGVGTATAHWGNWAKMGVGLDLGYIYRYKHIDISVGCTMGIKHTDYSYTPQFGLGYVF